MFKSPHQSDYGIHLVEEVRAGRMTRRELLRRASVIGFGASAVATLLAACGGEDEAATPAAGTGGGAETGAAATSTGGEQVTRGGVARIGAIQPVSAIDPVTGYDDGGTRTFQIAAEYLVIPRPDYTLEPRLATAWEGTAPDEWRFTIRQGVKWQDGSPLTVEDVIASFDRLTDPESQSAALSAFDGILANGNIEKVDEETIIFHLDRPYVDFPYLLSAFNYNTVILPVSYETGSDTFSKGGIGTGAFMIEEYLPQQRVKFVRNPEYWDANLPYLDGIDLVFYADVQAESLALQGDALDALADITFAESEVLRGNEEIEVLENSSSSYTTLQMRTDIEPFSDKRLRQAVAYALDRNQIVAALFGDLATVGNDHAFAPVFPTSPKEGDVPQREQDIERAKQLLADAGHADGFEVTLTTERYIEIPAYAQLIQEHCRAAGIDVKLNIQPQAAFYGSGDNQPWLDVPFGITDWASRGTASQAIDPAYRCGAVWNSAHWCNEEFDSLMDSFEAELDEQRRREVAIEAATVQSEEVPDVISYWGKSLRPIRTNVHGMAPGPGNLDVRGVWLSEA